MKIGHKLYALMFLYLFGISLLSVILLLNLQQNQKVQDSINMGHQLQRQSREVKSLMKDIVFDLFAPQVYGQIRSLTYSPRSAATLSQWESAVNQYLQVFDEFMDSSRFLRKDDAEIREQYLTALLMNQKTLELLDEMKDSIFAIGTRYRAEENIYNAMQKDASLTRFFNDFQETSYYFTNNFESFMNYFITTLEREGEMLKKQRLSLFFIVSTLFLAVAFVITYLITRDISRKMHTLQWAFKSLAYGNFSAEISIPGTDEFSDLSQDLTALVRTLKVNTDNILNLSRDVGSFISEHSDLNQLLELIVTAVLQDTSADAVSFYNCRKGGGIVLEKSAGSELTEYDRLLLEKDLSQKVIRPGSYIRYQKPPEASRENSCLEAYLALPIVADGRSFGILTAIKTPEGSYFSDLGVTRLVTFSEYVSLTIDHFFKYNELLERREAKYQALHSQLQPHFIYNILGGIQGLNRKGDRDGISRTVDSLKVMLRYIQSTNKWAVIEDEVDFIRKYFQLQSIRFGDRIRFEIDVDDACLHIQIPRLLIQPLVENALIHGLESLEEGGILRVRINALRHGGEMGADICIEDNGVGFDPEEGESTKNIGLMNVQERLKSYLPSSSFTISSAPGMGTTVVMRI